MLAASMQRRGVQIGIVIAAMAVTLGIVWRFARRSAEAPVTEITATKPSPDRERSVHLSDADQQRIGVTFATAEVGMLRREIRTVAQVGYDESRLAAISLKVDGWIERLDLNTPGAAVRPGDKLFSVYSPALVSAQQELLLAGRLLADVADASSGTRSGAEEMRAAAYRRLQQWDVPVGEIESVVRDGTAHRAVTFRSPVGGVVIEKLVVQGQRVMAGETLFLIADLGRVWLDGEVFGQDLAAVHLGQAVTAEFPALPGETRSGRIGFVYPTLSTETRTAHVRVELANSGLLLKPGMYATIRILSVRQDVLTVPRSSVLTTGERSLVFVRDTDGRFVAHNVVVGESTDDRIEIISGLRAGEVVVASATFLIDAESNLDKALGGMGNMPGMDMKPAPTPVTPPRKP